LKYWLNWHLRLSRPVIEGIYNTRSLFAASPSIRRLQRHFRCTALDFVVPVVNFVLVESVSGRVRSCVAERCCIGFFEDSKSCFVHCVAVGHWLNSHFSTVCPFMNFVSQSPCENHEAMAACETLQSSVPTTGNNRFSSFCNSCTLFISTL
jgi:hypothetical protein